MVVTEGRSPKTIRWHNLALKSFIAFSLRGDSSLTSHLFTLSIKHFALVADLEILKQ